VGLDGILTINSLSSRTSLENSGAGGGGTIVKITPSNSNSNSSSSSSNHHNNHHNNATSTPTTTPLTCVKVFLSMGVIIVGGYGGSLFIYNFTGVGNVGDLTIGSCGSGGTGFGNGIDGLGDDTKNSNSGVFVTAIETIPKERQVAVGTSDGRVAFYKVVEGEGTGAGAAGATVKGQHRQHRQRHLFKTDNAYESDNSKSAFDKCDDVTLVERGICYPFGKASAGLGCAITSLSFLDSGGGGGVGGKRQRQNVCGYFNSSSGSNKYTHSVFKMFFSDGGEAAIIGEEGRRDIVLVEGCEEDSNSINGYSSSEEDWEEIVRDARRYQKSGSDDSKSLNSGGEPGESIYELKEKIKTLQDENIRWKAVNNKLINGKKK